MKDFTLVVLHKTEASFGYYHVPTGRRTAVVNTRPFPHEICMSPDRKNLFIAEMGVRGIESTGPGGHTVAVYDARSRQLLHTIDTHPYDRPHGVAAHENGTLFVTSESTKHLLIYELNHFELKHTVFLDQECAHMVSVTHDGRSAYTANIFSRSITEVDVESGTVVRHIPVLDRPEGMVLSPDDRLIYVVNRESRAVSVVERESGRVVGQIDTGDGPVRVVISPDGRRLAIPLFHANAVQIADTESLLVTHTIPVGRHPAGTTLSPDGQLVFMACEDENRVYVFDMETAGIIRTIETDPGCDAMVCFESSELL